MKKSYICSLFGILIVKELTKQININLIFRKMKKTKFSFLLTAIAIATTAMFTSCTNEDVNVDLTLSVSEIVISEVGETETVNITSGNGNYTAGSSAPAVATASVNKEVITITAVSEGEAIITVTDKAGYTATINVTVGTPEVALTSDTFTWEKLGNNVTGVSNFGLSWSHNTATNAVIIKATTDGATKLVRLATASYAETTTDVELIGLIDGTEGIERFEEISVTATEDYDEVIGVVYNDDYYILDIQRAVVATVTGQGTKVTVTGEYKTNKQ